MSNQSNQSNQTRNQAPRTRTAPRFALRRRVKMAFATPRASLRTVIIAVSAVAAAPSAVSFVSGVFTVIGSLITMAFIGALCLGALWLVNNHRRVLRALAAEAVAFIEIFGIRVRSRG